MKSAFSPFVFLLAFASISFAQTQYVSGPWTYTLNASSEATIVSSSGMSGAVVIPSSIDGKPVKAISSLSSLSIFPFSPTAVTSVVIPDGVVSIGNSAFRGCYSLTSVNIPGSVTNIGQYAFAFCSALASVNIPGSVTGIGDSAFRLCSSLTSVNIPSSVTGIGDSAFENCSSLASVNIPGSVTSIGDSAFEGCYSLTSVNIPGSVTNIGQHAFAFCENLTTASISKGVSSIGAWAFLACDGLTGVAIPETVNSIGEGAFSYCENLASIQVDAGNPAFTSLENVLYDKDFGVLLAFPAGKKGSYTIPSGVSRIGAGAFGGSSGLQGVNIPNTVTSIGGDAFSECSELKSVIIPDGVKTLERHTFSFTGLRQVTIGSSVEEIEDHAFLACGALSEIYFRGNAPSAAPLDIFEQVGSDATVYYIAGTSGWGSFYRGLPTRVYNPDSPSPTLASTPTPKGITSLTIIPQSRTVKAGKTARSVKLMVMVANDSMDAVPVTVALSAQPAGVVTLTQSSMEMTVPGKKSAKQKAKTKRQSFTVLVPPTASGDVTIKASVGALSASSTLRVQAAKK